MYKKKAAKSSNMPPPVLKPSFFQQCRATSEQTALIADFENTVKELFKFHAQQAVSMQPVWTRNQHLIVAQKLKKLLGWADQ